MLQSLGLLNAEIAGIQVSLSGLDAWLDGPLGAPFRRFPVHSLTPRLSIALHPDPVSTIRDRTVLPGEEIPDYPITIARTGSVLRVRGWWLDGEVDLQNGTGTARIASPDLAGSLENFLRVAVAHLLLPEGGFLLHAAAVVLRDDERAVVAFGPSDAGKTTIASLAGAGRRVISDDLVALRRGADGRLAVIPTLFRAGDAPARPEGHPVGRLLRLRKGASLALRPLSATRGAMEIVGAMPFVHDHPSSSERALALAVAAAADPGVAELTFAPVAGVWDDIESVIA